MFLIVMSIMHVLAGMFCTAVYMGMYCHMRIHPRTMNKIKVDRRMYKLAQLLGTGFYRKQLK